MAAKRELQRKMHNNKGMSLVETLVTLVITSIVLAALGGLFLYITGYYQEFSVKKEAKMIVDSVCRTMNRELIYATDIYISHEDSVALPDWVGNGRYFAVSAEDDLTLPGRVLYRNSGETEDDLYGDIFYENGYLAVTAEVQSDHVMILHVALKDAEGEVLYERDRTITILNMDSAVQTAGIKTSMPGVMRYTNEHRKLYFHVAALPKVIQPSPVRDELLIWKEMQSIFAENTKLNPDYYRNLSGSNTVSKEDRIMIVTHPYSVLACQYQVSDAGITWPEITDEILELWSLDGKLSGPLYMIPYHYRTQSGCDVCFVADDSDNADAFNDQEPRQLLFIQEENCWYYMEKNDAAASKQLQALSVYDASTGSYIPTEGIPVAQGSVIQYQDEDGLHQSTIHSSYQVKLFFKTYGHQVAKKEEAKR